MFASSSSTSVCFESAVGLKVCRRFLVHLSAQSCCFALSLQLSGAPFFITLPGVLKPQLLRAKGHWQFVGDVIDAAIAKFKLNVAPQQLRLFKLDGGVRTLLDPVQTLGEAGIQAGAELAVEVIPSQAPFAPQTRA